MDAKEIKTMLAEYYMAMWRAAEAAERDTDHLGESYLIGVCDGKVEAIGTIYAMLYGEQAMMELWQSVYLKEDKDD